LELTLLFIVVVLILIGSILGVAVATIAKMIKTTIGLLFSNQEI